ncbi:MAG: hypothetical protein CMJ47_12820 [Planctomyces sp.]|nr:hypothetical protein [Planctomyces sp.]
MNAPNSFQAGNRIAVSFRGYNVTNAGKTRELLSHPLLEDRLRDRLAEASRLCHDVLGLQVDLYKDVAEGRPSSLETYSPDLATIVATELAHWDALRDILGKDGCSRIRLLTGYSLGEVTAVIVAGLMSFEAAMAPILELSVDAAVLAPAVSMGIVFSRGPSLDVEVIREKCIDLTARGNGIIAISTYLSPNTVLLMGEGDTVDQFKAEMADCLPRSVHLRKNPHHWPPLHTPIVLKKHLRDRAAVMLQTAECKPILPELPILSCVEGDIAYNGRNTRHLMTDWVDHPQLLWDCVHAMLCMGIDQVIHLGPEPNILPATLTRLADNVQSQLDKPSWYSYGLRTFSRLTADRRWLANLISRDAALLRAPFVKQVILEDWLVESPDATEAERAKAEKTTEPA